MRCLSTMRAAALLFGLLFCGTAEARHKPPIVIKVGVSEYQDIEKTYQRYVGLFRELAEQEQSDPPVTFQVAVGTYGEVRDWYNSRLIEVAVLAAMPAALLIESSESDQEELSRIKASYIGTLGERIDPLPKGKLNLRGLFPNDDELARSRERDNADFFYRTAAVVLDNGNQRSPLTRLSDLSDPRYRDRIKYIFVRPYSVSGYILPIHFLKQNRIDPTSMTFDFSYQHKYSLARLIKPLQEEESTLLVAFVLDKTLYEPGPKQARFRKLNDTEELDQALIPYNAVVINHNLNPEWHTKLKQLLSRLFQDRQKKETPLSEFRFKDWGGEEWIRQYQQIKQWIAEAGLPRKLLYKATLDQIIDDLKEYESSGKKPRLALVLSGGGAKCAYQAGAIAAIEERLEKERNASGGVKDLDIDLVVGTSGGSINALMVALGITQDKAGREALKKTWQSFRQKDFFQPSFSFNLIFGLSLGILQALFFTGSSLLFGRQTMRWKMFFAILAGVAALEIVLARHGRVTMGSALKFVVAQSAAVVGLVAAIRLLRLALKDWWRIAGWMMLAFSFAGFVAGQIDEPRILQLALGQNHWISHLWPPLTLVGLWAFPWPLVLGMAMVISGWKRVPRLNWNPALVRVMTIAMVGTSVVLAWDILRGENSLSSTSGIRQALARGIPTLLAHRAAGIQPDPPQDVDSQLAELSQQIVGGRQSLLMRDLIITASRLHMEKITSPNATRVSTAPAGIVEAKSLPDDLYFYYESHSEGRREFPAQEQRLISFQRNPTELLHVVIGSSAIYPVFPSQTLREVWLGQSGPKTSKVEELRIVDGGFIHNSPIDAARIWGATHILLIEASPEEAPLEPNNFWENVVVAFNFLFSQAQRIDKLSVGAIEIFQLRPTSPCERLEFVDPLCQRRPEPDLDSFDFAPNLVGHAIQVGYEDVAGATSNRPKPLLTRVPGPPAFRDASKER